MWLQVNQGFRMHELWLEFLDIVLGQGLIRERDV
jgi:hypothetical protein